MQTVGARLVGKSSLAGISTISSHSPVLFMTGELAAAAAAGLAAVGEADSCTAGAGSCADQTVEGMLNSILHSVAVLSPLEHIP